MIYFNAQIISDLASGSFFTLAFVSCHVPIKFFEDFRTFSITIYSRLILFFLCPNSRISHFSEGHWVFVVEIDLSDQDLGTRCAPCFQSVIASRPCQIAELWNLKKKLLIYSKCICTHTHLHAFFMFSYQYILKLMSAPSCLLKFQSNTSNSNTTLCLFLFPYFI